MEIDQRALRQLLASRLLDARYRRRELGTLRWVGVECEPSTALAFVRAQVRAGLAYVKVPGRVMGSLQINRPVPGELAVSEVDGSLQVFAPIGDTLWLTDVGGIVIVSGQVGGTLYLDGTIAGKVTVFGQIGRLELVALVGSVGEAINLFGEVLGDVEIGGTIADVLNLAGGVHGNVEISGDVGWVSLDGTVAGDLVIDSKIDGDVHISGHVGGNVEIAEFGNIRGNVIIDGTVAGAVVVNGSISGRLDVRGSINGLSVNGKVGNVRTPGTITGRIALEGEFTGPVVLAPASNARLTSVRFARFESQVEIGERIDISTCDFRNCHSLSTVQFLADQPLGHLSRAAITQANPDVTLTPDEMALVYSRLRQALHRTGNRAAAAHCLRLEREERRLAAHPRSTQRWLLGLFKHLSGYGHSIARPLVALCALAAAGTLGFALAGLDLDPDPSTVREAGLARCVTFSLESLLGLLSPPAAELSTAQALLQLGLRVSGPAFLLLTGLAIRNKLAR